MYIYKYLLSDKKTDINKAWLTNMKSDLLRKEECFYDLFGHKYEVRFSLTLKKLNIIEK